MDPLDAGFIPDVMLGHNGWGEICGVSRYVHPPVATSPPLRPIRSWLPAPLDRTIGKDTGRTHELPRELLSLFQPHRQHLECVIQDRVVVSGLDAGTVRGHGWHVNLQHLKT